MNLLQHFVLFGANRKESRHMKKPHFRFRLRGLHRAVSAPFIISRPGAVEGSGYSSTFVVSIGRCHVRLARGFAKFVPHRLRTPKCPEAKHEATSRQPADAKERTQGHVVSVWAPVRREAAGTRGVRHRGPATESHPAIAHGAAHGGAHDAPRNRVN